MHAHRPRAPRFLNDERRMMNAEKRVPADPLPKRPTQETLAQFVIHYSAFIVHRSSFIVHHSSFIVHRSSFIVHRSSFIIYRSSFIVHHLSFIIHRSSFIVHHSSLQTSRRNLRSRACSNGVGLNPKSRWAAKILKARSSPKRRTASGSSGLRAQIRLSNFARPTAGRRGIRMKKGGRLPEARATASTIVR
jgi:hypothetical protein